MAIQQCIPSPHRCRMGRSGFTTIDMLAGLILIVTATGILFEISVGYLRVRNQFVCERTLRLAAQSQLERYRAGIRLDAPPPDAILPPNMTLTTSLTPGTGPWEGMTRLSVTASGEGLGGHPQSITVSGYLAEVSAP
ncbi:MAG: hypothetical protein JXA69_19260 [Phycisphaerae bacterium]|nr:hypothetical protein [Phycisphaerae bacterium]